MSLERGSSLLLSQFHSSSLGRLLSLASIYFFSVRRLFRRIPSPVISSHASGFLFFQFGTENSSREFSGVSWKTWLLYWRPPARRSTWWSRWASFRLLITNCTFMSRSLIWSTNPGPTAFERDPRVILEGSSGTTARERWHIPPGIYQRVDSLFSASIGALRPGIGIHTGLHVPQWYAHASLS
jgi:hypothetical protein